MEYTLSVLLFAFSTAITPGPNNIMVMSSGLNYGIKRSMPHIFGVCCSLVLMVIVIGAGLGTLFDRFPMLHTLIKALGITYLLYLAWQIANAGKIKNDNTAYKPLTFFQAAAFQWVNPKAWVVFVGAISAFTNTESPLAPQIAFIALCLLGAGLVSLNTWLWFGASMKQILQTDRHRHYFNISMASLLTISVIPMALSDFG